ncbi:NAD(P)/FAD-dependent oxidoreductase [Flavihumibacter sediminis]|nr:NAD(P)/FAD-dependent oxidoreductase [Flavihumibacter sediminis]
MVKEKGYDVLIVGGGLAGLTLALQLSRTQPDISILVLEKRKENAPEATHKVGESLSELGSSYLRNVLDLKDYLSEHQLPKFGFRFFLSPEHTDDISRRVELGSKFSNPFKTHQLDRGLLENELVRRVQEFGVEIVLGAKVIGVELSKEKHLVQYEWDDTIHHAEACWIVDSSGRNSFLKRKLDLAKDIHHDINSAWFRLDAAIDIDNWSDDLQWRNFVDPGKRRLATNHLMGEGYWVWLIPLISGRTSIGIVADPKFHPFNTFNTFEKAFNWLEKHEPLAARILSAEKDKLMDFKVMKSFAYDVKQFYSSDKWAVAGEAGAFMDPLYSPGSDFIGLSNSWITDLIVRHRNGENIALRTLIYDLAHKELLRGWITLYKNMYGLFGKTQIMLLKIVWDWAAYWAIPNVLFNNNGYTNPEILKQYSTTHHGIGRKFSILNEHMQQLFLSWGEYAIESCSDKQLNIFDLACLHRLQSELINQYLPGELMPKIESNLKTLELIAAEIFRLVSSHIHDTPNNMHVDPYEMKLTDGKELLLHKSKSQQALAIDESIQMDIAKMWVVKKMTPTNELVS